MRRSYRRAQSILHHAPEPIGPPGQRLPFTINNCQFLATSRFESSAFCPASRKEPMEQPVRGNTNEEKPVGWPAHYNPGASCPDSGTTWLAHRNSAATFPDAAFVDAHLSSADNTAYDKYIIFWAGPSWCFWKIRYGIQQNTAQRRQVRGT